MQKDAELRNNHNVSRRSLFSRELQVAILFLLCTGVRFVPDICSSFSSDFLFWNYWNDNKEPAYLICQLAFLLLGKYLILFFFSLFFFLARSPCVHCASISLLTLDKEEQIPSTTCIFAFSYFPTQTYPQSVTYPRKLRHLSPLFLDKCSFLGHDAVYNRNTALMLCALAQLTKPCWNQWNFPNLK